VSEIMSDRAHVPMKVRVLAAIAAELASQWRVTIQAAVAVGNCIVRVRHRCHHLTPAEALFFHGGAAYRNSRTSITGRLG